MRSAALAERLAARAEQRGLSVSDRLTDTCKASAATHVTENTHPGLVRKIHKLLFSERTGVLPRQGPLPNGGSWMISRGPRLSMSA